MENRYLLDGVWDEDARDYCLEQGDWNFAARTQKIEYDSSIDPDFGFQRAFAKPSDWKKTTLIASDEYFHHRLTNEEYVDEQGYWFSDFDELYVKYVSNDAQYGYDLTLWPQTFVEFVEHYMAWKIAPILFQDTNDVKDIMERMEKVLVNAKSKDARNEGAKFHPPGSWVRARRSGGLRDRGSRSNLTG